MPNTRRHLQLDPIIDGFSSSFISGFLGHTDPDSALEDPAPSQGTGEAPVAASMPRMPRRLPIKVDRSQCARTLGRTPTLSLPAEREEEGR